MCYVTCIMFCTLDAPSLLTETLINIMYLITKKIIYMVGHGNKKPTKIMTTHSLCDYHVDNKDIRSLFGIID
jgi:hypothetical protein